MPGRESLVEIRHAKREFVTPEGGRVVALAGISLEIRKNEFLTLLGPSGCGKTTLLRAIAGFEDLDAGEIALEGASLAGVPAYRRPFNTVFQNYALFPHLSVADNVGYGLDVSGVMRTERDTRVAEALTLVGLFGMERRKPKQLSGGQQQRIALARALVNRPKLLLLDEPLSALDRNLRQAMQIELKTLQHQVGITFLVVTHDQEEALAMSDRIAVMREGAIQQVGSPGEVYDRPANRFVANFIGSSNIFTGKVMRCDQGMLQIETQSGITLNALQSELRSGDSVEAMLRPEQLEILNSNHSDTHAFTASVENVVFIGADRQVHVRLHEGTLIKVLQRHTGGLREAPLALGAVVKLGYSPASVHVIPMASSRG